MHDRRPEGLVTQRKLARGGIVEKPRQRVIERGVTREQDDQRQGPDQPPQFAQWP